MKNLLIILALLPVLSFGQGEFITHATGMITERSVAGSCVTTRADTVPNWVYGMKYYPLHDINADTTTGFVIESVQPYIRGGFKNYQPVLIQDSRLFIDGKRIITLNDFLEYTKECYRDSTKEFKSIYKTWNTGEEFIGPRPEPWEMIMGHLRDTVFYSHKEFKMPGFIQWLKKK